MYSRAEIGKRNFCGADMKNEKQIQETMTKTIFFCTKSKQIVVAAKFDE